MNYTSIEQSKKLIKLELSPDTADMLWIPLNWQLTEYYVEVKQGGINTPKNPIPCWSLGALLELMPEIFEDENDRGCNPILSKGYDTDMWHCLYRSSIYITDWYESPIDAAFEMVCWLLEKGYIKKENKMDYKQKYEYILERARIFIKRWNGIEATDSELVLQELKEIFPELKESEDEKIRKEIIQSIQDNMCVIHKDKCIEKQGEQKPAWSEEDEYVFRNTYELVKENKINPNKSSCAKECLTWLKSIKERLKGE